MDWFKHSIGSHDDPDISEAMDRFGHAGYSIFFILLEIYGTEFNRINGSGQLTLKWRYFRLKARCKRVTTELVLSYYRDAGRIQFSSNSDTFTVSIPKFLELASNYTRYQKDSSLKMSLKTTEKKRSIEEKKNRSRIEKNKDIRDILLPDWLDKNLWNQFKEHRVLLKSKLSTTAENLNLNKLISLKEKGYDYKEIIETTIANGWKGFYEPKQFGGSKNGRIKSSNETGRKDYPVDIE